MDDMTKQMISLAFQSGARHVLGGVAVWMVGQNIIPSAQQTSFTEMGVGIASGTALALWKWYDIKGRTLIQAHLKKMTGTKTVADANAVATVAPPAPLASPTVIETAKAIAGALLLVILLLPVDGWAQAPGLTRPKLVPLTGNVVNDINASRAAGIASGNDVKLTGDPIADLHAAIQKQGAKLIMHLKQSYALATAKGTSGSPADNTLAMCTKALVPIVSLVVNGPPAGTLDPADPMTLTAQETTMAADTGEPEGVIVKIEKLRILRLALTSPALNDACGALVQDEVKNAQGLVGKLTSLFTGAGLVGIVP